MPRDISVSDCSLYFLPAPMRVPLKFGAQTLTQVYCARVCIKIKSSDGKEVIGWGETPLSVGWVWPSTETYEVREKALKDLCISLAESISNYTYTGHAFEIAHAFIENELDKVSSKISQELPEEIPHLASLVCFSAFDIALHDAYAKLHGKSPFEVLNKEYMNKDLSSYLEADNGHSFAGEYPEDFLVSAPKELPVWHLVGGLDPLDESELLGDEPNDGYPVTLEEWIKRDGLTCLKIKLKGNNSDWDYERIVKVGEMSDQVKWLTTDFNCTVTDPEYVNTILDRLRDSKPEIYGKLLYVEQPFPYDLKNNQIDVHSCSARKPLFMDESAHDWTYVRLGRSLGWNGVALKTCKTFTGAILSLCWAKAHGMTLMVQDLTNPMLAQIPHVQLAAHAGTIMGVESNGMQFYPEVSKPEQEIHPGLYRRNNGILDLSTLSKIGFGYKIDEISRTLPEQAVAFKSLEVTK